MRNTTKTERMKKTLRHGVQSRGSPLSFLTCSNDQNEIKIKNHDCIINVGFKILHRLLLDFNLWYNGLILCGAVSCII